MAAQVFTADLPITQDTETPHRVVTTATPVCNPDGTPIGTGGGGGSSQVEVTNFPATQPVSGPLTNAQFTTVFGAVGAAAYTDVTGAANGTAIALLKGIFVQLAEINAKTVAPGG